jgi:radical SAM protein with 4Fe4S-binding SPASM domain
MGRLRYGTPPPSNARPSVVVWNVTRACNLRCLHCYANATPAPARDELTTTEGYALLDDLAAYRVPVLILSGGEPLVRPDLLDLAAHAVERGLRVVLSTNGTLLADDTVTALKDAGVSYVGVSVDGLEERHDLLRGVPGAFRRTVGGLRRCRDAGLRVGLRFTLTRDNVSDLPGVLALARHEGIPRLCVYHLVYAGRGADLRHADLTATERRKVVSFLLREADRIVAAGEDLELLTVDNHADAALAYLHLLRRDPVRAAAAWNLLVRNGGNGSGLRIAAVDARGFVHPDQFWTHHRVGTVRDRPFSELWENPEDRLLRDLRDRSTRLAGRCATCRFLPICNGNMRVRAEAAHGDVWADDPSCYLTDDEIRGKVVLAA